VTLEVWSSQQVGGAQRADVIGRRVVLMMDGVRGGRIEQTLGEGIGDGGRRGVAGGGGAGAGLGAGSGEL